jgi:acetaldehyde dehydrogenase (acetylating)
MELMDRDLVSIQETRNLIRQAKAAQKILAAMSQNEIDKIVRAIADAAYEQAERLGRLACEETGFGVPADKTVKNQFASKMIYESIKELKTVGVIREDSVNRICEIAVPMGVIAALIPSTNPTSTVIYKTLIAIKSGNAIVFSPHPGAKNCIAETVRVVTEAAVAAGCPKDAIGCLQTLTIQSTNELMRHDDTALILATGGGAMVKAAYSSGNPAIGVGPGNGPAFLERTADIPLAVKQIIDSKTFDNGVICASEQSIVTEECIEGAVIAELEKQGAYFLPEKDKQKVAAILMRPNGLMNPQCVGKSPQVIAELAGIAIPRGAKLLIGRETEVGENIPFSREKLCPVLAFYEASDWEAACERCIDILNHEGAGHTMVIHSNNEAVIKEFALKKPVNRLLVNTPGALGGIGATTNLTPALTLGCGTVGGSSTSDNIGPLHLINIRRVAYGMRELFELKGEAPQPGGGFLDSVLIEEIVKRVMAKFK